MSIADKKVRGRRSKKEEMSMNPQTLEKEFDLSGLMMDLVKNVHGDFVLALEKIAKRFEAFGAVLWQVKKDEGEEVVYAVSQWFEDEDVHSFHDLPISDCFTGKAITKKEFLFIRDVYETEEVKSVFRKKNTEEPDNAFLPCTQWFLDNDITALASAPTFSDFYCGTALTLYWKKAFKMGLGERVGLTELASLTPELKRWALDRVSANLVQKATKIMRERRKEGTLETQAKKDTVVGSLGALMHELLNPLITSIYLQDPQRDRIANLIYTSYSRTEQARVLSYDAEEGLISWVLKNKKPVLFFDLSDFNEKHTRWVKKYKGIWWYPKQDISELFKKKGIKSERQRWSIVIAPILNDGQCLGAISCFANTKPPYFFADREATLLEIIAGYLGEYWASWMPKSQRIAEDRSAIQLLEAFGPINRLTQQELSSFHPKTEPILDVVLKTVEGMIPLAEIMDVRLRDVSKDDLYFAATLGKQWHEGPPRQVKKRMETRFPINHRNPKSAGARVIVFGKTVRVHQEDHDFETFPETVEIISVPINDGETIRGVLDIRTTRPERFSQHDQRIAEILGQLLGLSLSAIFATNSLRKEKSEINQFYQDFTHQMRTPVFQAQLRARDLADGNVKNQKEEIKLIASLTRKAVRVVNSYKLFLDLSREEHPRAAKKPINTFKLRKALEELTSDFSKMTRPSHKIGFDVNLDSFDKADLYNLSLDWGLVEHALGNILDNAVKYSYNDTEIKVFGEWTETTFVIVTGNSGMKLSQGEIPFVTQRGWRSTESEFFRSEGMGIGLWIVNHIMSAHDGRLVIAPTNAAGKTTVKLVFPVTLKKGEV